MPSAPTSMVVPGMFSSPRRPAASRRARNSVWSGKMLTLVALDDVEAEEVLVEEARRPGAGHHGAGVDLLHEAEGPGELALDLRRALPALLGLGHLVDHRVPDGPGELEPVQVDRPVGAELAQVVGAAVVLVDQTGLAVGDHQGAVAAGPVGDGRLHVDRHGEPGRDLELLLVDGADELGEAQGLEGPLLLAGREPRQQDRDVAAQVGPEPGLVVVVAVEVRDVEEVGPLDPGEEVVGELVVAGEREPGAVEGGDEPRVAQDRPGPGLDEDPRVSDRRGAHRGKGTGWGRLGRSPSRGPTRALRSERAGEEVDHRAWRPGTTR